MTIGLFQVDPFPDPTHSGQEIENVGLMFAHFFMLIILIILMIYLVVKFKKHSTIITVYLFSMIIGVISLQDTFIPCTPYFQILFLMFQTTLFIEYALNEYKIR